MTANHFKQEGLKNDDHIPKKLIYVNINDVLKAMKLSYRGTLLWNKQTKPMVASTLIYLVGLIEDSKKEYTNSYFMKILELRTSSQISGYRKRHKHYMETSERYALRITMAVQWLNRRERWKKRRLMEAMGLNENE